MNEKLDRRKKYTRMVLKDSLIELLNKKQISAITVKEICAGADINRSTFYTHYKDPFDLLNEIEKEIIDDMNSYLSQYNFNKEEESLKMMERLFEYVVSKREVFQTLLNENGDTSFERRVMEVAREYLLQNWVEFHEHDEDFSEYISIFIISGCIHIIKNWLNNDFDKSPKEMAAFISQITNNGLKG
ncbi:TetR/AcrR family transcriptional regulator [Virgibacillus ainsalahensis]